jgi:hypothetical protein
MQQTLPPPRELTLEQLERMRCARRSAGADRLRVLLKCLVEHSLRINRIA